MNRSHLTICPGDLFKKTHGKFVYEVIKLQKDGFWLLRGVSHRDVKCVSTRGLLSQYWAMVPKDAVLFQASAARTAPSAIDEVLNHCGSDSPMGGYGRSHESILADARRELAELRASVEEIRRVERRRCLDEAIKAIKEMRL